MQKSTRIGIILAVIGVAAIVVIVLVVQANNRAEHIRESEREGRRWRIDGGALYSDCIEHVTSRLVQIEGWDEKAWLEGCTAFGG